MVNGMTSNQSAVEALPLAEIVASARLLASRPERTLEDSGIIFVALGALALAAENERLRSATGDSSQSGAPVVQVSLDGAALARVVLSHLPEQVSLHGE